MSNPAINAALIAAAAKQAEAGKSITEQLKKAGARNARSAVPVDLSVSGSDTMLAYYEKHGHVRAAGGGRYWLDEEAIARSNAAAVKVVLIALAFLLSVAASLIAYAAGR